MNVRELAGAGIGAIVAAGTAYVVATVAPIAIAAERAPTSTDVVVPVTAPPAPVTPSPAPAAEAGPGGLTLTVTVPALAIVDRQADGTAVSVRTNTGWPPGPADQIWFREADGSMVPGTWSAIAGVEWYASSDPDVFLTTPPR